MPYDLKNRFALVTGSSRGIGAAIATELASLGDGVVLHCHKERLQAETVAREITALGGVARVIQADLNSSTGAADLVRAAFSASRNLDILVNNAGGVFDGAELATLTEEQIDRVLRVNVRLMLVATREFITRIHTSVGRIVNISSIAGH